MKIKTFICCVIMIFSLPCICSCVTFVIKDNKVLALNQPVKKRIIDVEGVYCCITKSPHDIRKDYLFISSVNKVSGTRKVIEVTICESIDVNNSSNTDIARHGKYDAQEISDDGRIVALYNDTIKSDPKTYAVLPCTEIKAQIYFIQLLSAVDGAKRLEVRTIDENKLRLISERIFSKENILKNESGEVIGYVVNDVSVFSDPQIRDALSSPIIYIKQVDSVASDKENP